MVLAGQNHPSQMQIAGEEIARDPNHPVEVYYGNAQDRSLSDMAESLGVTIYPEDKIEAFPDPEMGLGSQIIVTRATKVIVTDAKVKKIYRTWQESVKGLLKEKKIDLLGQDSATPGLSSPLSFNMNITITRVAEVEVKETESIDYKVIKQYDSSLEKGNDYIDQKGVDGEKTVTYKVKRVDGEEVSREVVGSEITEEPQNEIKVIGTKVISYGSGEVSWFRSSRLAAINTYYAASHSLPKGTVIWLVNSVNGQGVKVVVLDYMENSSRLLDISPEAFCAIGHGDTCDDSLYNLGVLHYVRAEKYYP